jgi:hypothetical protein
MYPFRLPQGVARLMTCLLLVFPVLSLSSSVAAQTDSLTFRIGHHGYIPLGETVTVPVTKIAGAQEISGFDFRINFDYKNLDFQGIVSGQLFAVDGSTQWEDLTYTVDTTVDPETAEITDITLHVIGERDIPDGHTPLSQIIPDGTSLFHMVFVVTDSPSAECLYLPIQFYWASCADNTVALVGNPSATTGVSRSVYFYDGGTRQDHTDDQPILPTYSGLPQTCLDGGTPADAIRLCDFDYSGIEVACGGELPHDGDVNLNGIQYEIADYVLFSQHFLTGELFEEPGAVMKLDATDVNQDGIPMQLEDLVYFMRVIVGDAMPYMSPQTPPTASIAFLDDVDAGEITFDYSGQISALYLKFLGEVEMSMSFADPDLTISQFFDGEFTRVLIIPELSSPNPTNIEFTSAEIGLTYAGDGYLIEADAADYYEHVFNVSSIDYGGKHAVFVQRYAQKIVEVYATEPLAAVEVHMEGSIVPTILIPAVQWAYREESGVTIISILPPPLGGASFGNEPIFSYSGEGKIVWTDAANTLGEVVPSSFVIPIFYVAQNNISVPGDYATIQAAIDNASDGDTVVVEPGTYTGPGNRDIDFGGKRLVLMSLTGPEQTIIDCQGSSAERHRGFIFQSGEDFAVIEGFSVINGFGSIEALIGETNESVGGAVFCRNASRPQFRDCSFSYNHADDRGGAVHLEDSDAGFKNCRFVFNTVSAGGRGGALYIDRSQPLVDACTFEDNGSDAVDQEAGYGGAVFSSLASCVMTNCRFERNRADFGGALACLQAYFWGPSHNNLFVDNDATIAGGAVRSEGTRPFYSNFSTYAGNNAPTGSAISVGIGVTLRIDKSIIVDGLGGGAVDGTADNIVCTDIHGNAGGDWTPNIASFASINGNISADPMFCDPVSGDWSVSVGSPCAESLNPCNYNIGALGVSCGYVCGDATDDARADMADVLFLINMIFRGGPMPSVPGSGDANCDGNLNIIDALHLVNFLFRNGPWPCCPSL